VVDSEFKVAAVAENMGGNACGLFPVLSGMAETCALSASPKELRLVRHVFQGLIRNTFVGTRHAPAPSVHVVFSVRLPGFSGQFNW